MSLQVTGKLKVKYDTVQVKESFKKREFVLEMTEDINGNTYTNYGKFQLVQNKCEQLDKLNEGDAITVDFNIKGNAWEKDGKTQYITNLDAWRVAAVNRTPQPTPQPSPEPTFYNPSPEQADDLPF